MSARNAPVGAKREMTPAEIELFNERATLETRACRIWSAALTEPGLSLTCMTEYRSAAAGGDTYQLKIILSGGASLRDGSKKASIFTTNVRLEFWKKGEERNLTVVEGNVPALQQELYDQIYTGQFTRVDEVPDIAMKADLKRPGNTLQIVGSRYFIFPGVVKK